MKKTRMGRTVWAVALIICFIALFTTCKNNIGLGGTVDINPPTLDVSTIYPPAGAVIRDDFILSIEAKDDSGIASVNVSVINTAPTEQPDGKAGLFELKKASDGLHWTAQVNKKDDEKGFPLKDGTYKVQLIATDTAGKTVQTESTFTIDNTAPLLVLNRPSTTTKDSSVDVFGDGFLLVGQVYDDTPVAALTVTAKGKGESDPVFTKVVKNVPQNIRITVDAFSSDKKQEFYQGLYGTKQDGGQKDYEYRISVTDDAKVYKTPGDNGVGPGNSTDRYYLFDDLYSDVLSEYRIQTVYNMMRGTYRSQSESGTTRSAAEIEADKNKMAAVQAALKKAQLGGDAERKGTFGLNPSLNPRFDIAGEVPIARPESGEPKFSRLYSGSTLTVKVSCNLDGIPLEGADSYRFFLMEWTQFLTFADKDLPYPTAKINSDDIYADADKTTLKPEFIELKKNDKVDKEGSNYIFTLPVSTDKAALSYGKSYVLLVRGKDKGAKGKPGNELIPDSKGVLGGVYGFYLVKNAKAPEVFVTKINETDGTGADGNITERVYLKKDDSLKFKMKLQQADRAQVTYTLMKGTTVVKTADAEYQAGEHEVTIEAAAFDPNGGTYQLSVKAAVDGNASMEQVYHIVYDVKGPDVVIEVPVNNEKRNDDNKKITIAGTAFDAGAGLKSPDPVTVTLKRTDSSNTVTDIPVNITDNGEVWKAQELDLSAAGCGEGIYTLKVSAKDKLDQESSKEYTFIYDVADPKVTGLKINNQPIADDVDGDTVYVKDGTNVTIEGAIQETYGLKEFKINDTDAGTLASGPFGPITAPTLANGSNTLKLKLVDKADKTTVKTVKVVVDGTAPSFNEIAVGGISPAFTAGNAGDPGAAPTTISAPATPVTLTGKVTDADSGVKQVAYTLDTDPSSPTANWNPVTVTYASASQYTFDGYVAINAGGPAKKVTLRVTDKAGNYKDWTRDIKVTSTIPDFDLQFPPVSGITDGVIPVRSGSFTVKMGCYLVDALGTQNAEVSVTKKIGNASATDMVLTDFFEGPWVPLKITDKAHPTLTTYTVKAGLESGVYTITIKANNVPRSWTVTVDNTGPEIELVSPSVDDPQAGLITIQGTISDAGSSVKKEATKYLIAKTADIPAGGPTASDARWHAMDTSTAGRWTFKYNFAGDLSTNPSLYGTQHAAPLNAYYDIPVYILGEDALGNKTVYKGGKILFNPDGKKPVVKVLAPQAETTVGGTIQIFGTTTVAIGTPADIGTVYIQFSKTGNFTGGNDGLFGSKNWQTGNGGKGEIVPETDQAKPKGGASWSQTINTDGSFNNPGGQNWNVWFRVRAENRAVSPKVLGEWSAPIKISIDKSAPTIGSPDALKVKPTADPNDDNAVNFTPNMWIKDGMTLIGSLYDISGLKEITISGDLEDGATYDLTQAKTAGWIVEDPAHVPAAPATAKNYKLKIPLTLNNLSATAKANNAFKVKITITEDTTHHLTSEQELQFRFDKVNPFGDFGEYLHISNGTFAAASITDATLAGKLPSSGPYTHLGILAGNYKLTINSVSGNTVNFAAPAGFTAGTYNYILYQQKTLIYNDDSIKWILKGVGNDEGSGIDKVEAKVTVAGKSTAVVTMTETNSTDKISKQLGGQVTWEAPFDLEQALADHSKLKDGKGTLEYTTTDKSGNVHTGSIPVRVKNKKFKVSKITLMTKIGGETVTTDKDNPAETDPQTTVTKGKDSDLPTELQGQLNQLKTVESKNFAFKSKDHSTIKVEFLDGEGIVKYRLKKGPTELKALTDITSGTEINLKDYLDTIGNSNGTPTEITLELWDSAYGCTPGTDSSCAIVKIKTLFDALDTTDPTVVILPFHWNSETDNSLYQNKRENGHVEIAKINSLGNEYSSVSGKVTLRGFAYDNIELNEITAALPNSTALTVTATRQANGTWSSNKTMAADGAVLTVEKLGADYRGYYAKWQLDWDTEKADVAATAKEITVTAKDGAGRSSQFTEPQPPDIATKYNGTDMPTKAPVTRETEKKAEDAVFASAKRGQVVVFKNGETQYLTRLASVDGNKVTLEDAVPKEATDAYMYGYKANKTKTAVNVVPYITGVVTGLTSADSSYKGAFSRASTGEYPVREGERIQILGFNIGTDVAKVSIPGMAADTVLQNAGTSTDPIHNTITLTGAKSGAIVLKVNNIEAINNKVDVSKPYNIEANNMNNDVLTANRKLFVWKMDPIINNNAMESPQFVMDKGSNYYLVYGNLRSIGSGGSAMRLSTKITKNGIATTSDTWEHCYSKFQNTMIGYDSNGNPYLGATDTDRATGISTGFSFCFQQPSGSSNYYLGKNKTRLENCDNMLTNVYDVNRVRMPKIAVRGGGTTADPAKIALVYFDSNMKDDAAIKFRYGTVTGTESNAPTLTDPRTAITGGISYNVGNDGDGSDPVMNITTPTPATKYSGSAKGYEVIADTTSSTTYKSGLYAAVGLTSTNRAIAVWYDATNSRLVYSYRDMGTSYTAPDAGGDRKTTEWQNNAVVIDGGAPLYVDLVIDEENGLHIGYYSSANGGVRYAYLAPEKVTGTATASDFKIATVDTYMNPGTFLKMGVRKEGSKQVPYISYYHNGFYGSKNAARIAWLKDGLVKTDAAVKNGVVNNKFTGDWVVMTVPASNGIQQYTICQGVPTSGDYANKVVAAYFTNKNYEMAVLSKN